jgi:rRNA maturation endonuclease Nob1
MKEKITDRIEYLTETKKELMEFYLETTDEIVKQSIADKNMQISMEISFLNELLQYDVIKAVCDGCQKIIETGKDIFCEKCCFADAL